MKEIQLTKGYIALVDDSDYERVARREWCAKEKFRNEVIVGVYAQRGWRVEGKTKSQSLHRFIMNVTDPAIQVDHEDHDGLNCQKYNLRVSTPQQNASNALLTRANTSGFKGVSWNKDREKWRAYIHVNNGRFHLGYFTDPFEAACAYDMAAVQHFGEFAHCNFARL
jgi:hypothetical protein